MGMFEPGLTFQVEEWSADGGKLYRTLANCARFDLAVAIHDIMLAEQVVAPRVIMIRNRARVVRHTRQEGASP